jgi:hypothetical protein
METMNRVCVVATPLLVLLALAAGVVGCSRRPAPAASTTIWSSEAPASANLTSPRDAVTSYLEWTSYAYLIGNSDVASHTMSPEEEVRVNSYTQLNKEQQRRITQALTSFKPRRASVEGTRATVGASEVWHYRYLSADGARAISETYTASYEATYNLVLVKPKTWVVDSVDVRSLGEVK